MTSSSGSAPNGAQPRAALWERAALAAFGVTLAVFAYQGLFDSKTGGLHEIQDYVITLSLSERTASGGAYVEGFAYSPAAIVLKLVFGAPGRALTSVLWMGLIVLAACVSLRRIAGMLPATRPELRYAAPLLGFVATLYFIQWDFKTVNSNLILLALVLAGVEAEQRGGHARAALMLATSFALKTYSAPVIGYWGLHRRWPALGWTGAFLAALFIALPVAWFGADLAWQLTLGWIEAVLLMSNPTHIIELKAYKISFYYVALMLFGEPGSGQPGNLASLPIATVYAGVRTLQAAWVIGVGAYLLLDARRETALPEGVRVLTNVSLMLLTMLLLSPLLQPHHAALLWAPCSVLAWVALARDERVAWRAGATALLVASIVLVKIAPSGAFKGAATLTTIFTTSLLLMALGVRAWRQAAHAAAAQPA